MINSFICSGRHVTLIMAQALCCLLYATYSFAWQQEYVAEASTGDAQDRYTWDSERAPSYNDILAERIQSSQALQTPLWHTSVSTVGWRLDYASAGYFRPWAQVSYNYQYGDNSWKTQAGPRINAASLQDASWRDVTLGADMPLGKNVAAFASVSQAEGLPTGEAYMYNLGVNVRF